MVDGATGRRHGRRQMTGEFLECDRRGHNSTRLRPRPTRAEAEAKTHEAEAKAEARIFGLEAEAEFKAKFMRRQRFEKSKNL